MVTVVEGKRVYVALFWLQASVSLPVILAVILLRSEAQGDIISLFYAAILFVEIYALITAYRIYQR